MKFTHLFGGEALFPSGAAWETSSTANSGCCLIPRNPETDAVIAALIGGERLEQPDLADGVVVMLTSAAGEWIPGEHATFRGLCILTPKLEFVWKKDGPVLIPTPGTIDEKGVEDARLTFADGVFYAWYCGYNGKNGRACLATSRDLLHWEKYAPLPGNINDCDNKDHVAFPEKIGDAWYMLHRPWGTEEFAEHYNMPIRLAKAESPLGPWNDMGILMRPIENPEHAHDWLGGGAQPLPLGNGRYLEIYHAACYHKDNYRVYCGAAAILDFNHLDPKNPASMVTHRLEPMIVPSPEFPNECNAELGLDNFFPMGVHLIGDTLYIAYGAGDKVSCGVSCSLSELLAELEQHPVA